MLTFLFCFVFVITVWSVFLEQLFLVSYRRFYSAHIKHAFSNKLVFYLFLERMFIFLEAEILRWSNCQFQRVPLTVKLNKRELTVIYQLGCNLKESVLNHRIIKVG